MYITSTSSDLQKVTFDQVCQIPISRHAGYSDQFTVLLARNWAVLRNMDKRLYLSLVQSHLCPPLTARELAVLAPLIALVLGLGFYPKPVLDVVGPSVGATMSEVGATGPATSQGGN